MPVRIGLIGLGRIGAFHADTLSRLPAVDAHVVSDPAAAAVAAVMYLILHPILG